MSLSTSTNSAPGLAGHKFAKKVDKSFPFFNLPRELRDRVYSIALITRGIDIDLVPCASDDDDQETLALHPQPRCRTTYTSLGKKMTYRLQKPRECHCGDCPNDSEPQLQLFYVSRTVYEEAREIFYAHNEFNTVLSSGLGCNAFFKDRESALRHIRTLSFDVPLHTADFNYGRWSDAGYIALIKTIKDKTAIRHLTLNFHGLVPDVTEDKWRCPCDCQVFEHPLLAIGHAMGMPDVPVSRTKKVHEKEWALIKSLVSITNLQRLSINIDFCYHMLDHDGHNEEVFEHDHIRSFVAYLRSRMLKKGEELSTTQIHGYCRIHDEVDDKRYRFHSDDDEYGKSHLAVMITGHKFHRHEDSGSELDDDDMPDLEDVSDGDEWDDETDDDDGDSYSNDETDSEMPQLGNWGGGEEEMLHQEDDELD